MTYPVATTDASGPPFAVRSDATKEAHPVGETFVVRLGRRLLRTVEAKPDGVPFPPADCLYRDVSYGKGDARG
jgi:hypothetical protein